MVIDDRLSRAYLDGGKTGKPSPGWRGPSLKDIEGREMESLAALLQRKCGSEKATKLKALAPRIVLFGAWDTTTDGLLVQIDAGSDWFNADSIEPPSDPLRLIVVRQSDGESSDSPYHLLERVMGNIRKVVNGLCEPDWNGLLACAFVDERFESEWIDLFPAQSEDPAMADLAAPTGCVEIRKRAAFIKEVVGYWESIEADLSDSNRNGLYEVAKNEKHGFWNVEPALTWGKQRGNVTKLVSPLLVSLAIRT